MRRSDVLPLLPCLLAIAACGEPMAPHLAPGSTKELEIFMVLDPDTPTQALQVAALDVGGSLIDPSAELFVVTDGDEASVAQGTLQAHVDACVPFAIVAANRDAQCITFDFAPVPGGTYRLRVGAKDHTTASALVTVPEAFEIEDVATRGIPPSGVTASWTGSRDATRFFITVLADGYPPCRDPDGCPEWYAIADRNRLDTDIPSWWLGGSTGPWTLHIHATGQNLSGFLTADVGGGDLFPVPPAHNVQNGVGLLGAWVRRHVQLPMGG